VSDEHHGVAFIRIGAKPAEQRSRLFRRKHGRRLIEDQQAGIPSERLGDLDSLLRADR